MVGVAALGFNGMNRPNDALHHVVDVSVYKMDLLGEMAESVHVGARVMRTIALLSDEAAAKTEQKKIEEAREKYAEAFVTLEKLPLDEAGKNFVARIKEDQLAAKPINDKFLELAKTNKDEAIQLLMKEAIPKTAKWQNSLHEFMALQKAENKNDEADAEAAYRTALYLMLAVTGMAVLFGGVIAWLCSRSIPRSLEAAVKIAQTVAAGDLSSRIEVGSTDETGQLLQALKQMNGSLVHIVGQVRGGTDTTATASKQIAVGNVDMSSRTEHQAGSLEETASSMEELTSTVKQNADNARQANQLAVSASDVAVKAAQWYRKWSIR